MYNSIVFYVLLATLLLAACSSGVSDQPSATTPANLPLGTLHHSASDCTLELDQTAVTAGTVILILNNTTDTAADFDMWRIAGEHTYEEFVAHITEEVRLADAGLAGLGPPSYATGPIQITAPPGDSQTSLHLFTPGVYGIVCFKQYLQAGWRPSNSLGPILVE